MPELPIRVSPNRPRTKPAQRLGAWLKVRRLEISRSLKQAAVLAHCSDAWLCQLESGHANLECVRADSLRKVATAYDLNIFDLLEKIGVLTEDDFEKEER